MTAITRPPHDMRHVPAGPRAPGPGYEWLYDAPTHQRVLVPVITRRGLVVGVVATALLIALVVATLLFVAWLTPRGPTNSHPGDAQPRPVGQVASVVVS